MTYALSIPLQRAVFDRLRSDGGVAAALGEAIFDALPVGAPPDLYVTLGDEEVLDRSDSRTRAALHRLELVVRGRGDGFLAVKTAAAAVCAALEAPGLVLSDGRLSDVRFRRARARRLRSGRQITLQYDLRVEEE